MVTFRPKAFLDPILIWESGYYCNCPECKGGINTHTFTCYLELLNLGYDPETLIDNKKIYLYLEHDHIKPQAVLVW